jgi:hypothetical protein
MVKRNGEHKPTAILAKEALPYNAQLFSYVPFSQCNHQEFVA